MKMRLWRYLAITAAIVLSAALLLPKFLHTSSPAPDPFTQWVSQQVAAQAVQRGWQLAKQAGAYHFHTDIDQTIYSAPALTNVGRPAAVQHLHLDG